MASPLEFSILSYIIISGASVLGYGLPPYRIFYTVIYILLKSFCTRSFCHRIWPPPYRIFYTVIYIVCNLFSGVSVPGASVLGYGLPPIEFPTLSSIEYNNNLLYTPGASVLGYAPPPHRIFYTVIHRV